MTGASRDEAAHSPLQRTDPAAREAFIRDNTVLLPVPHVPALRLHLAHEALALWSKTEEELGEMGLPPPFWAFAWAGGQALARYILDNPVLVRDKRVLDFGAGSGIVAIAAAMAGAAAVTAAEIDGYAEIAIRLNARANGVDVTTDARDLLSLAREPYQVVLAGDVCYERPMAERVIAWLDGYAAEGAVVLIGDPGRSYLPRDRLEKLIEYQVPVSRDLEDAEIKRAAVWRFAQRADQPRA
ncbi:class I SAM-dependent methyltransferase [Rhodoligotrophos defluvii]|uniref:class I SAM-dependent methyltransferase n=1 Tax=Rhodoligotrophos defluvii TaxID=2561934 RepID=UPI001EF0CAD1|nr:50S ribosomal protein L11 methyltransferase [Rhodoligotrophos defluvii]